MPDKKIVQALRRYIQDPVAFVKEIIGVTPDEDQTAVLSSVPITSAISVKSGHGVGKTAVLAWIIIWFVVTHPFARVPVSAPTMHQLDDILWPEVAKWVQGSKIKGMLEWQKTKLAMKGFDETWFAVPRTASQPENLQGFHGEHILFVIDEASGMRQDIMDVIEGALTSEGAKLIMVGNPTQLSGTFHASFHRDRELYKTFTFSSERSPLVSKTYVERMAKKYGKDSDVYRVRVLGEFPRGAADDFIPLSLVESAVARDVIYNPAGEWMIGVDPARFGDDESTIASICESAHVMPIKGFYGLDGPALAGMVAKEVKRIRLDGFGGRISVKVDVTGVGASCFDQLNLEKDALWINLVGVNFGGEGDEYYYNTAALMWGQLKDALSLIHLPDDDDLIAQLSSRKYSITPDGKIKLERKEDMKARGITSPDRADAVVLAYFNPPGPVVDQTIARAIAARRSR